MLLGFMSKISVPENQGPMDNRGCEIRVASAPSTGVLLKLQACEKSAQLNIRSLQGSQIHVNNLPRKRLTEYNIWYLLSV